MWNLTWFAQPRSALSHTAPNFSLSLNGYELFYVFLGFFLLALMHVPCPQWSYHRSTSAFNAGFLRLSFPTLSLRVKRLNHGRDGPPSDMLCAAVCDINTHFLPGSIIFPSKTEKHLTLVVSVARWGLRIWNLADMIMTPWQPGKLRWFVMAALELITTFWTFSLEPVNIESPNSLSLSWFPGIGFNCMVVWCQVSLVEHLWNI